MAELKDSGARREFETGAVRDIQEGKGRCDLLPLDIVASLISEDTYPDSVLTAISRYVREGEPNFLIQAIRYFSEERHTDLYSLMLEVAKHYEDGARKYSERNWEKGINLHCFIDSGVRHYLKCLRGDTDEPHDRAFVWNMLGAVWTHNHKPELIDLPFNAKGNIENLKEECRSKIKDHYETCFG